MNRRKQRVHARRISELLVEFLRAIGPRLVPSHSDQDQIDALACFRCEEDFPRQLEGGATEAAAGIQ